MKSVAHERAALRRPIGTVEAESLVVRILTEEHVSPWPPRDVIAWYADEMERESLSAKR